MILPTKPGVRLGILPALILIIFGAMAHPPSGAKLSGTVRNETGEAMAGVAIYLAELNLGAESDASGHFEIPNLPRGHHLVEFSHIGYKTVVRPVDLAGKGAELQIDLVTSPVPSHPVVVSAPYQRTPEQTPYTLARLDRGEIQFSPAITLTEALTRVPGISQISTGTGITKPVIRGLHGNRVLTVFEGFRFDNQQWQDEHGLGLADMGIRGVEVVKGPASMQYGSDAMGGVINLIEEKNAPPAQTVSDANVKIDGNTLGLVLDAGLKGGSDGFFWKLRGGGESHADYLDGDGTRIPNTRFNGGNAAAGLGWVNNRLVSNLNYHFSFYQFGFVEQNEVLKPGEEERFGREMEEAYHQVYYHLLTSQSTIFTRKGRIKVDAGVHLNNRREQEGPEEQALGNLNMQLNTFSVNPRYLSPEKWHSEISIGGQATFQGNSNSGERIIIPDAATRELAGYAFLRHQVGQFVFEEGLRVNQYHLKTEETGIPDSIGYMPLLEKDYQPVSGALGLVFNATADLQLKANFAMGYRAPNLAELASNGLHEGTLNYEIGDPDLASEQNRELDVDLNYHSAFFALEGSFFRNAIDNYIYLSPTGETRFGFPVYRFLQSDATLTGGEASLNWRLPAVPRWSVRNSFSALVGKDSEDAYLPLMPANRMRHSLRWDTDLWRLFRGGFVEVEWAHTFQQDKLAAVENKTPGYDLINIDMGGRLFGGKITAHLLVSNLLGEKYYDHLSRIKPGAFSDPTVGFHNMGRNITFAMHIPIGGE